MDSLIYQCPKCYVMYYASIGHICLSGPSQVHQLKQYESFGDNIAVEPWPEEAKKPQAVGGAFKVVAQKNSLRGLKVIIGNERYPAGSTIFVSAEAFAHVWAKTVYEVDGLRFSLCPLKIIEFVRYYNTSEMNQALGKGD